MVLINNGDIFRKLHSYNPGNRMPLLCAVYRSFGRRIVSENNEHEKGIRSEVYDTNSDGDEDFLTCMALSEDGVAAIGSGNREGCLYFIQDRSAVKDIESGARFIPLHKEVLGSPIFSLDWTDDRLLVGLNNGITNLYKVEFVENTLEQFELLGQYTTNPANIKIHAPFYVSNTHVKSTEFAPNGSQGNIFLSTTVNQISVWDKVNTNEPLYRIQADTSPLQCASWSHNEPQSLIVYGGCDRNLSIIDTRINKHQCVVWNADNAHDRPITDAKFNTFIPYWLASAGEDSLVNIWDIRSSYRAPVAKIDGNIGVVTSIAWSSIRPENLGTTSSDGTMRFWSLYPENFPLWDSVARTSNYSCQDTLPIVCERDHDNIWCTKQQNYSNIDPSSWASIWGEDDGAIESKSTMMLVGSMGLGSWGKIETGFIYKGEEVVKPRGSAVAIKASKLRPSTYYSISSGGQLVSHTIRFDSSSNIRYRHRFDPQDKDKIEAEIEDAIYCRRITKAHAKLDQLKAEIKRDEHEETYRKEAVDFLEDCLQLRGPIKETEWGFDTIPDKSNNRLSRRLWNDDEIWDYTVNIFKRDLKYWSYRIPPGYNTRFKFPLDFHEPIIAERLVETERIITELPPFTEDLDQVNLSGDMSYNSNNLEDQDNILTEESTLSKDNIPSLGQSGNTKSFLESERKLSRAKEDSPVARRFDLMDDAELGITSPRLRDRRNTDHLPSIITTPSNEGDNLDKVAIVTPPYSAPGIQQNIRNNNPFGISYTDVPGKSLSLASSRQTVTTPQDSPTSRNPFEPLIQQEPTAPTNPFEPHREDTIEAATPLEAEYSNNNNGFMPSTNPFEEDDDDAQSVRSIGQKDNTASRSQSWVPDRLGTRVTTHTDVSQRGTTESAKKRNRFNVFKKFSKNKRDNSNSSTDEYQQQKREERILSRQSSTRRNALHGPF